MTDAPAAIRLRRLATARHALGPKPIYEFPREIKAGAEVRARLEVEEEVRYEDRNPHYAG